MPKPFPPRESTPAATPSTELRSRPVLSPYSEDHVLKVCGGTPCKKLAQAVIGVLDREKRCPVLEYIGAGAGSQAVKAIAIANATLHDTKRALAAVPIFCSRAFTDNPDMTAIQLRLIVIATPG